MLYRAECMMFEERLIISYLKEQSGDLVETLLQYFVGETEKNTKSLSNYKRCPYRSSGG
jgi:hypothetical protein